jgi:ABC-type phosphate transport system substrate-binding protein
MKPQNNWRRGKWLICIRTAASFLACLLAGLAFGEPAKAAPATPTEALVIIVNKANPLDNLTTEELRKYFRLEREQWPNGRKNTVLMLPPGTPEREAVLRQIYQFDESEFSRHFLQATFTGQIHSAPKELASAVNMRKFVFNVPGAIGYVRASEVDDTVKVIRVDGLALTDKNYPFKIATPGIK